MRDEFIGSSITPIQDGWRFSAFRRNVRKPKP